MKIWGFGDKYLLVTNRYDCLSVNLFQRDVEIAILLLQSEIYRLPYIHMMQNNSTSMDRDKNSIQMGYQYKNLFVCCLFVYLHFRQSFISVAACTSGYRH